MSQHSFPNTVDARLGLLDGFYTRNVMDNRAPVGGLSPDRRDYCIRDAARSTSILGMHGSACAAMTFYSEACYSDCTDHMGRAVVPIDN